MVQILDLVPTGLTLQLLWLYYSLPVVNFHANAVLIDVCDKTHFEIIALLSGINVALPAC